MASKEEPGTAQQAIEYEIMSVPTGYKYNNDEILNQIDSIHVTGGGEFDTESLFILVENIFNHAAPIVGSYVPVHYTLLIFRICMYAHSFFVKIWSYITLLALRLFFFNLLRSIYDS